MSHPATSSNKNADSSIRLVQESTWPSQNLSTLSREDATKPLDRHLPSPRAPTIYDEHSITITTSLEVASASPFSTASQNMASRFPKSEVHANHAPSQSTQLNIRASRSAGALNEKQSQPPLMPSSDDTSQPRAACSVDLPHHHHAQHQSLPFSESKLPEFRQSRRWARYHEAARYRVGHQERKQEEVQLSMREASFEQQRAKPRTSLRSRTPVPAVAANALSETNSFIQAQGLCKSLSAPTWHMMKSTRFTRPYSLPSKWDARKLCFRRHRRTRSKSTEGRASVDITSSPRKTLLRRRIRPRKAVADLRRRAGLTPSIGMLVDNEKVVDLDSVNAQLVQEKGSSSPIPSLHDPEKAKRFSQECEALLCNADFDKDWQTALKESLAPLSAPLEIRQQQTLSRPSTSRNRLDSRAKSAGNSWKPTTIPDSLLDARKHPEKAMLSTAPEPPLRTSSKGGPRLASIVHLTKPACIPFLHGFRDATLVGLENAAEPSSTRSRANHPTHLETPSRTSSGSSAAERQSHGPRAKPSTDTLTMIEAQIQDSARAVIAEKLKRSTAFIVGSEKRPNTGSGTPPERPLPALPTAEQEVGPLLDEVRRPAEVNKPSQSHHIEPSHPQKSYQHDVDLSGNASSKKLRDLGVGKSLTIETINTLVPAPEVSPTLPTPSSTYSHMSLASRPSLRLALPRHDMSQLRPERIRELKKRLKDDLARERRISEEDETRPGSNDLADRPLAEIPNTECSDPIDPLDQFPTVPESRPQSCASVSTRRAHSQSRSRSHARHSSKASSIRPRIAGQILGTSEIKVLVDSNPVTGRFRAGALSPAPSFAGSSREGSPVKTRRVLSNKNSKGHDVTNEAQPSMNVSFRRLSFGSLRSHTGVSRPPRRRSSNHYSDSEDDINSPHGSSKVRNPGTKKVRRRWNSNDMQTVQMLFDDLEHYYETIMKQELELRKQREEIQMIVRVFAPISRPNGLKTTIFKALEPEAALERERVEAQGILEKEVEGLKVARERKSKVKEKEGVGKLRPISHLSSTSATTSATLGSIGTATDERTSMEGSMTDPFEYDFPGPAEATMASSVSAPAAMNLKGKTKTCDVVDVERKRPGSRGSLTAMMHQPPPVAKVIPKGKLAEEEDGELSLSIRSMDGGEGEGEEKEKRRRLSINHVLTSTEQMDRALEDFRCFL